MAIKYEYTYAVVGAGRFPFDMLRYDRAYPASEGDSRVMENTGLTSNNTLRLTVRSDKEPTIKRWSSFGWHVIVESVEKRKA